jgi:hypothetical protein
VDSVQLDGAENVNNTEEINSDSLWAAASGTGAGNRSGKQSSAGWETEMTALRTFQISYFIDFL